MKKIASRDDATARRKKKVIKDRENLLNHDFKRVFNGLKDQ